MRTGSSSLAVNLVRDRGACSDDECWEWQGYTTPSGYGRVTFMRRPFFVHRLSYELYVAPIPVGLTIDHLCRNRRCFNPCHLEPVSVRENIMRAEGVAAINAAKTHCVRGHHLTPESTYTTQGKRNCKACVRVRHERKKMRAAQDPAFAAVLNRGARAAQQRFDEKKKAGLHTTSADGLGAERILSIHADCETRTETRASIALRHGVSPTTVTRIANGAYLNLKPLPSLRRKA